MEFSCVVAMDKDRGIGKNGVLPWRLPNEMKYFHEVTSAVKVPGTQNVIFMGRTTWESIPEHRRPLPNRLNIVMTHNTNLPLPSGVMQASTLAEVYKIAEAQPNKGELFCIGGAGVFNQVINRPQCVRLYVTEIDRSFDCNVFFPEIPASFKKVSVSEPQTENDVTYHYIVYERSI